MSQQRFLMDGTGQKQERWNIPVEVRSGTAAVQRLILRDDQSIDAGRCEEPFLANAGGLGFYRVAYDAKTLATNSSSFSSFSDADKIALLDDQWAFAGAGTASLEPYLGLASQMGNDLDARAWKQIADSLSTLERDERNR
ncbi:MAG: ERAP1-like C-terminal domain-containing protein, partial [Polyangiaceae bacterium]